MRKLFLRICGFALICAALVSCGKKSEPVQQQRDNTIPITVAKVESVPMDRTLPIVGTLFAKDEATVSAEVEGKVERTMAEFGDRLTNGQEIAFIDTASYEALTQQAAAKVAKAKATALNAEQTLKRTKALQKEKISSPSDLDKAVADAEQAAADVKSAEADEAIAQLNLKRSRVTSPFDSAVADRVASAGDFMKVGSTLFRVVNDGVLKYIVQAPESYAGKIEKKQLVTLSVDAWPGETFEGKVYLISPQVNTSTRAFAFGALVQNPERKLKASTFARGEVILEHDVPTTMIPLDAVLNFAGVTKVFVIENDAARSRDVQVGRIKNGKQEIVSGVKAGEMVATSGQTKLTEGAKVRVKDSADGKSK